MARDFTNDVANYLAATGPDDVIASSTPFSISCRIRPDTVAAGMTVVSKFDGTQGPILGIDASAGDKPRMFIVNSGGSAVDVVGATAITTAAWHQLGGGWDGSSTVRVILDGVQDGTGSMAQVHATQAADWNIGRRPTATSPFDGLIAEVALWVAYLTDGEWASLGKGFSPLLIRPQSLKAYWPILGNVSPEPDPRGGNNATINGTLNKADHPHIYTPASSDF